MFRSLHLITLAIVACTLASCDQRRTVDRASDEKVLLLGNGDEPAELDPQVVTGVIESNIIVSRHDGI